MVCDYSKCKCFADRAGGGEGREVAAEPAARHGGRGRGHQGGASQGGQAVCVKLYSLTMLCCSKVIGAEGEQKASRALKEASDIISSSPAALQLRYLQVSSLQAKPGENTGKHLSVCSFCSKCCTTLSVFQTLATISSEKNSTIVFPIPIELLAQ